jgi:diguanylate cyclase (GGDEF)-like protein
MLESDSVLALLLAQDGAILARNRASNRIFPPAPESGVGETIWDYLACSDARQIQERLGGSKGQDDGRLLLNVTDERQNPITLEIGLIRCGGEILLLGTEEHRQDAEFHAEIHKMANELSVMVREVSQKNRELKEANETIERVSRIDPLTGLANRRTLSESLVREIARAGRFGEPLSLVIIDLDHFKSVNDQYGHVTGDHVLEAVATALQGQIRAYDLAARYGGDEFLLLLPGSSNVEAMAISQRILKEVATIALQGYPLQISISLGVASWIGGEIPEEFVARADSALYRSKHLGRNRITVADILDSGQNRGV